MITYTNANTAKLPTTPSPPPEKSWDKQDRAKAAAIKELGPAAIPGFDFTIFKCDGRWMWRATAEDKRPPVSAQQVKANGGKVAVAATLADKQRVKDLTKPADTHSRDARSELAGEVAAHFRVEAELERQTGEAVFAAAIQKKTADKMVVELTGTPAAKLALEIAEKAGERLAKAKIDATENENGMPKFLKRESDNSAEAQKTRIERHKKTIGPDRQIKNPPNVKDAQKRAEKGRKSSMLSVGKDAIMAGKTNDQALADVKSAFPKCEYKAADMQWIRRKLVREGKLKDAAATKQKNKSK